MSKRKAIITNLTQSVKDNREELFASLSIFVGLPLVAWLYFDYRAALTVFVLAVGIISVLALRSK